MTYMPHHCEFLHVCVPPVIHGLLEGRNEAVSRDFGVQGRKWHRGIVTGDSVHTRLSLGDGAQCLH